MYFDSCVFTGVERCTEFEEYMWFDMGKSMWRKHCSIFQYHVKYIHNDILKPFRVGISQYSKHICEMYDPIEFMPPPSNKGDEYDMADFIICDKKSLRIIFTLQLSMASPNKFRMGWRIKISTINPCPMTNDVASCPYWR